MMQLDEQTSRPPEPSSKLLESIPAHPTLVSDFLRHLATNPSKLPAEDLVAHAKKFLVGRSEPVTQYLEQETEFKQAIESLRALHTDVSNARMAQAGLSETAIYETRKRVNSALVSIRNTCDYHDESPSAPLPTLARLEAEIDFLSNRASRKLMWATDAARPIVKAFTEAVQEEQRACLIQQALMEIATEIKDRSKYYPRSKSPEAEALEKSLLTPSTNPAHLTALMSRYVAIEKAVEAREGAVQADDSFFCRLQTLKMELQQASQEDKFGAMKRLRDLYAESGSLPLAYFANLNCLALGDATHKTLFCTFEQARELNSLPDLSICLDTLLKSAHSPSLYLHAFRVALELKQNAQSAALFDKLPLRSPERSFAKAINALASGMALEAEDWALDSGKKASSNDVHLSTEAYKLAILAKSKQAGNDPSNAQFARKVSYKVLARDPNDQLALQLILAPLYNYSVMDESKWTEVESLLCKHPSAKGWLLAGSKALELEEPDRADNYFRRSLSSAPRNAMILLAMAALYEKTDPAKAQEYLRRVARYVPHHPSVRPMAEPSVPTDTLVLPPAIPPALPNWSEPTRSQIMLAKNSGEFRNSLSKVDEYAAALALLSSDSDIHQLHPESVAEIDGHLASVALLLGKSYCLEKHWIEYAGHIYKDIDSAGYKSSFSRLGHSLKELSGALRSLDPEDDYFHPLQKHKTMRDHAAQARAAWGECATAFNVGASNTHSTLQHLSQCLATLKSSLTNDVGPGLPRGISLLMTWTQEMELLPI